MAYTTQHVFYLFTIIVRIYFSRSNGVEAASKLECRPTNSFEQDDHSFKAISIFNKSTFSYIGTCQKNLSLSNVSVEMVCLFNGKSNCRTLLRFSWAFGSTDAQDLLKEVTLNLMQVSPITGSWQTLDCEVVLYDDDDDDDDYTQLSSLETFVMDYDCCDVDQEEHGYFATLKATYEDPPSCKVGGPLTLMPTRLTPNEDETVTSSRPTELPREQEDLSAVTIVIPTPFQISLSSVRAAIVISFVVVVCVVVAIVIYLCIRRGSNNRRRFTERENSTQPFDLNNGSDVENFKDSSYLHNCPHCVHETIDRTIPDQRGILDLSGSDVEEDSGSNREAQLFDVQLDSGCCSGGPMFSSSEAMRTFASRL